MSAAHATIGAPTNTGQVRNVAALTSGKSAINPNEGD